MSYDILYKQICIWDKFDPVNRLKSRDSDLDYFTPADPDYLDTDPHENTIKFKVSKQEIINNAYDDIFPELWEILGHTIEQGKFIFVILRDPNSWNVLKAVFAFKAYTY